MKKEPGAPLWEISALATRLSTAYEKCHHAVAMAHNQGEAYPPWKSLQIKDFG